MDISASHYHRLTAYDRFRMTPHRLDWAGQPRQYKTYPDLPAVVLPEIDSLYPEAWEKISAGVSGDASARPPDLAELSKIFYLANGLTGRSRQQNGYFYYRSPPSAGALYPNELYLAWFGSADLEAGLYHYEPYQRRLSRLRDGNLQALLPESADNSPGVILVSGIFFRSAWKYRKRAYRYVLLDGGHLIESIRLALIAAGRPGLIFHDFDDARYNRLLGVDPDREVCLAGIRIGGQCPAASPPVTVIPDLPPAMAAASRVSDREVVYEEINQEHRAGETDRPSPADMPGISAGDLGLSTVAWQPFQCAFTDDNNLIKFDYSQTVLRRRSRRNFIPAPVSRTQFSCLLEMISRACLTAEQESPAASKIIQTGFLCWNVDNMTPGFYLLDPSARKIGQVSGADLMPGMTAACLDQEWLKNAAAHFLFMTDLEALDRDRGARGYRYAMMTAGRLGHMLYLAATAMGLGCCGIGAFYDNEAEQLLGLNEASALLYLVAVGQIK
jgi:SagB-type dehydrogenase family enzyme